MMRLTKPQYTYEETLNECIVGITGNNSLKQKMTSSKAELMSEGNQYAQTADTGELHSIPPLNTGENIDPFVINDLKKSELLKVYDKYFRLEKKPARKIYDALLNAAKEDCPYCGGIGTPRNLDHFLPKAHFPQFSILPSNLVPACRDCNMDGKSQSYANNAEEQILQPYVDNDRFFMEQWVYATYHPELGGEPGVFEYFTSPPEDWTIVDKRRVKRHFEDFNLAHRYAIQAGAELNTILGQINAMKEGGANNMFIKSVFLKVGRDTAPFVNHWKKGMFQALMDEYI